MQKIKDVKISNTSLTMRVKDECRLKICMMPSNAKNKEVTWTSSNPIVASVINSMKGNFVAMSKGVAVIKVKTTDGSNIERTCQVTVI